MLSIYIITGMISIYYDTNCSFCSLLIDTLPGIRNNEDINLRDCDQYSGDLEGRTLNTIVVIKEDSMLMNSDAALEVLLLAGGIYHFIGNLIKILPRSLRDAAYRIIALNRYRIFGKTSCRKN